MRGISARGERPPPFAFRIQSCLTNEPGNTLASNSSLPITRFRMQARAAVSALMNAQFLSDLFYVLGIFSLAGRTLAPGVKAAFRDIEHLAHDHNRKFLLVLFGKLIFHMNSHEKMSKTFFII